MVTVTLEYDRSNAVIDGILDVFAKMPDVKIIKGLVQNKVKVAPAMLADDELYKLADEIKASTNPNAPRITMDEIVQEIRDYRNGK